MAWRCLYWSLVAAAVVGSGGSNGSNGYWWCCFDDGETGSSEVSGGLVGIAIE
ncbi:hypothetical protein MKX03_034480 [Papaver bracteatum]|nr:hypothetical protein MKX03_034480 [Papaver bracteatum]